MKKGGFSLEKQLKSSLLSEIEEILEEANLARDNQLAILEGNLSSDLPELASMDNYDLTQKQKADFFYKVKPQFPTIKRLVENGIGKSKIANALGVSYKALLDMERQIPELAAVFHLGEVSLREEAFQSLMYMTKPRNVERQELDKFGQVHTLIDFKEPDMRAISLALKATDSRFASKDLKIVPTSNSSELLKSLQNLDPELLRELSRKVQEDNTIDITDDVEVVDK